MTSSGGADIPVEDSGPGTVPIVIDGRPVEAAEGALVIEAAQQEGNYIPPFLLAPADEPGGYVPDVLIELETPSWGDDDDGLHHQGGRGDVGDHQLGHGQEGAGGDPRVPAHQPSPRLSGVRPGGECPLQDQTMAYGAGESRFVEEKRHFEKPIPISDLVLLDRERCILCARCTRFSEEISGDPLIEFQDRGYGTQVNTFPDEPFRSYFSGNTVQICPVGALTATPYRFPRPALGPTDGGELRCTTRCTPGSRSRAARTGCCDATPSTTTAPTRDGSPTRSGSASSMSIARPSHRAVDPRRGW